jgi:hypothetical protein
MKRVPIESWRSMHFKMQFQLTFHDDDLHYETNWFDRLKLG